MTPDNMVENGDAMAIEHESRDEELAMPTEEATKEEPVPAGEEDDEGKVYPPARKVAVVMLALYLSLFLVSLVSTHLPYHCPPGSHTRHINSPPSSGSNNHRHRRPTNHKCLPLHQRHRLVRQRLYDDRLRLPASLRPHLHLLLPEMGLPNQRLNLRAGVAHLRHRAELTHVHCRPGDRGLGLCGDLQRHDRLDTTYHTAA